MSSIQHADIRDSPEFLRLSAALAMELVAGMTEPADIFSRWGYTADDACKMLRNPAFQQLLKEAKATWGADTNAEERIRLKARLALEELLPAHYELAVSQDTPAPARNEAVKTFERLSGMAAAQKDGSVPGMGERFIVNINLGLPGAAPTVTVDVPALEQANAE